jgi:nitroreductase
MQALHTLLWNSIDYAGLFPPASLPMDQAVRNYAAYRAGEDRWMLGRFVVPVARLNEFEAAAAPRLSIGADAEPWRLSALSGTSLDHDLESITAFNARHANDAVIDTLELKASTIEEIERIAQRIPDHVVPYVEIPTKDDPHELIAALARTGLRAKVRTGGVTADAFPAPDHLLRFLATCIETAVPFKATAGLHHPLRGPYRLTYEPDSTIGTMYGFLNVFLAAAFLDAGMDMDNMLRILLEDEQDAFHFDDTGADWRGHRLTTDQLARARQHGAISFGSCSFTEPIEDLRALYIL